MSVFTARSAFRVSIGLFATLLAAASQSVAAATPAVATLVHRFGDPSSQSDLPGPLVRGKDGNYYGVTAWGGIHRNGSIYKVTPAGAMTTLHDFSGPDGNGPQGPLALGDDGNFYGVTVGGSPDPGYWGHVFRITPSGVLTTLYTWQFEDPTGFPQELVKGPDGNFYGLTNYCCLNTTGTLFRITPAGQLTTLRNFDDYDGQNPHALVVGTDGKLYFTLTYAQRIRVYRMSLDGATDLLYEGDSTDVRISQLLWGQDGNLYGAITPDEFHDACTGSVFKLTTAGVLTTLHAFATGEGKPTALIQGANGKLYGVSECGSFVFEVTTAGAYSPLVSLTADEGGGFRASLSLGPGTSLFGTNQDNLYRVIFGASLTIKPKDAIEGAGRTVCATATKNGSTTPAAGFPLNFNRTGTNPGSAQVVTDALGKASVCWAGTNWAYDKRDEIDNTTVSDGTSTDTSKVTWARSDPSLTAQKMITAALKGPTVTLNPSAVLGYVEYYGFDSVFVPLVGRSVSFYSGSQFLCTGVTDGNGRAKCVATVLAHVSALVNEGYTAIFGGELYWYPAHAHGQVLLP